MVTSIWQFANKIKQSFINSGQSIFPSSHFSKFWNKNANTSYISLCKTNVIFLPFGCGLFFSKYSLSFAAKMEEGKDICLNVKSMHSEVAVIFNSQLNKHLRDWPHRQAMLIFSFTDNFSFCPDNIFSLPWLLSFI